MVAGTTPDGAKTGITRSGIPEQEVRALAFLSLVVVIVSLILVNRSFRASLLTALQRPNRTLLAAVAAILALTMLAVGKQAVRLRAPARCRSRFDVWRRDRRVDRA